MSALYQMRYQAAAGQGHGAIYIGKDKVIGVDITGARYAGIYVKQGAKLEGSVTLTSAGAKLVTGQLFPSGTKVPISFSLPVLFGDGQFHTVIVGGKAAKVAFDKIDDIP
jgi:hypothetical protein